MVDSHFCGVFFARTFQCTSIFYCFIDFIDLQTEVDEKASEQNNDEEESVDEPSEAHEEMRSKHVLKQAQMSRELKELNLRLTKTQELASQMENNSKEILEMREKHEVSLRLVLWIWGSVRLH